MTGEKTHLEETVDTADGELKAGLDGAGDGLLLVALLVGHGALGPLAGEALAGKSLSSLARHCRRCVLEVYGVFCRERARVL